MQTVSYDKIKENIIEDLKNIPAFQNCQDCNIIEMIQMSELREFDFGDEIIHRGDNSDHLYFLIIGRIRVVHDGMTVRDHSEYGHMFGEMSLLENMKNPVSVFAVNRTLCMAMDTKKIKNMSDLKSKEFVSILYRYLIELLAQRLRDVEIENVKLKRELDIAKSN